MKKGINQWAFGAKKLKDVFAMAKQAGYDGVEVVIDEKDGEINLNSTRKDIEKIVTTAQNAGVEISSLATGLFWSYSLTSDDDQVRTKARDIVKKMIDIASWLKVDTILVVAGAVDVFFMPDFKVVPYDKVYDRSLAALQELAPVAEKARVAIGVENVWNKFLMSPLEMKGFVDAVGSPYVGVYFDVGNVIPFGFPEQWIHILDKRIKKVHFKDYRRAVGTLDGFVNILYGDVDWAAVMQAFTAIGYTNYVTAELFPSKQHPESLIFETSTAMDQILGRR
ncbi:MAG: sugar phosphate isomerase/epimerase [Kiritimatiellae bacterium]|nr:sugar phosphate isomerase/epimerase [Kiritimatiellia bacterium]